jgi:hypothetical protein
MKIFVIVFLVSCCVMSCKDTTATDDRTITPPPPLTDAALFQLARSGSFTFYKNSPDTLRFTPSGGGHGGFIRVKFNAVAAQALTDSGRLPTTRPFPDEAMVVKEIYNRSGDTLSLLAVMIKRPDDPNAAGGWVWGEYFPNGDTLVGVRRGNNQCLGCHSRTAQTSNVPGDRGHRDYVRTFGLRP